MDEQLIQSIIAQYNLQQAYAYTPNVPFDIEHRDECIAQLQTKLRGLHRTYTKHLTVEQLAHILDSILLEVYRWRLLVWAWASRCLF